MKTSKNLRKVNTYIFDELFNRKKVGCMFYRIDGKERKIPVCQDSILCYDGSNLFWKKDTEVYYSPNLFVNNAASRTEANIFALNSIAIDIDYKKSGLNTSVSPLDFFYGVIEEYVGSIIPEPSYIEYGHQLRLIYVFDESVVVWKEKDLLRLAKVLVKKFADFLNTACECNAEPQKINSFYRYPGSVNKKDGSIVSLIPYSDERLTIQEMADEYLPDLPEWYKRKGEIKKKNKNDNLISGKQLWNYRLGIIMENQTNPLINREELCHLYVQALKWTDYNGDILEAVIEFNEGLAVPLKKKEVTSKLSAEIKTGKKYNYSNKTMNCHLGAEIFGVKEKPVNKRRQIADKHYTEAISLYKSGYSRSDIAKIFDLSIRTIKGYINRYNKECAAIIAECLQRKIIRKSIRNSIRNNSSIFNAQEGTSKFRECKVIYSEADHTQWSEDENLGSTVSDRILPQSSLGLHGSGYLGLSPTSSIRAG